MKDFWNYVFIFVVLAILVILPFVCSKTKEVVPVNTVNGKALTNQFVIEFYGTKPESSFILFIDNLAYLKLVLPDNTTCEHKFDRSVVEIVDKPNVPKICAEISWNNSVKNFGSFSEAFSNAQKVVIYTQGHTFSPLNMEY